MQRNSDDKCLTVHTYIPGSFDGIPDGFTSGCWNYYGVFKKNKKSTCNKIPQQRLYTKIYGSSENDITLSRLRYEPPTRFLDGILIKEKLKKFHVINPSQGIGHEYWVDISDFADCSDGPKGNFSPLQLYEDDVAVGPPHSLHEDIRDLGLGRFSHWHNKLYFSTSDNLPLGDRRYTLLCPQNPNYNEKNKLERYNYSCRRWWKIWNSSTWNDFQSNLKYFSFDLIMKKF